MPVVKEAHVELTMGRRTLRSWLFVADIKDDFILGLDILLAHDASVDIGRRVLRLGQDEMPVRQTPTEPPRIAGNRGRCVGNAVGPVTSGEAVLWGTLRKQSTEAPGGGMVQLE
jgi:hypothetical protein